MYFCKHCGFVSNDENIRWCNNLRCHNYGVMLEKQEPQKNPVYSTYGNMKNDRCFMPEVPCNDQLQLAFATVPFQKNNGMIYSPQDALKAGTIFPQLDMPWKSRIRRK